MRAITALIVLLTVSILAGCAAQDNVPPPDWSLAEVESKPIIDPRPLPDLCSIPWPADSTACWLALDEYDIISAGNVDVAQANADALRKTEQAYDALIGAGKLQQQLTEFYRINLADEKQQRWIDGMVYKSIMAIGLIAVAL